jgi:hypothetical protein
MNVVKNLFILASVFCPHQLPLIGLPSEPLPDKEDEDKEGEELSLDISLFGSIYPIKVLFLIQLP